jgi:hypothetical protein
MSFHNPTPIAIGMVGTFLGKRYRVAGRSVMGVAEEGETYRWNEFNLLNDEGGSVTLVYEETDGGGEWRLFTLFEPQHPMTAQEAATKLVGDTVNLDGTPVRVTLVDESRVDYIEGEAPEGEDVGDVARYFNADAGDQLLVASWTGDEIEFYRGVNLPRETVMSAFGLRDETPPRSSFQPRDRDSSSLAGWAMKIVVLILIVGIYFAAYSSCGLTRRRTAAAQAPAPVAPLAVGSMGGLDGRDYRIAGHSTVEIAKVGLRYERHEYQLVDQNGDKALLVCGSKPGDDEWLLFKPFQPATPLTPQQAAAKCSGDKLELDGYLAQVTELFRATIRRMDNVEQTDVTAGTVFYCFRAQSSSAVFLARWNERGIAFYRGKALPAKDLLAAFRKP